MAIIIKNTVTDKHKVYSMFLANYIVCFLSKKLSDRNISINFDIDYCIHHTYFLIICCCIFCERTKYDRIKIANYMKNECIQL